MPRRPRIHVSGGLYHVILRGNGRGDIFFDTDDRLRWESILAQELKRHNHRIHAYCWMSNHIHAAVQCSQTPLSGLMGNLSSRYAKSTNQKLERSGHLFERRYRAILVQVDSYLKELVRYIHRNPVRAGLVSNPAEYRWSSHSSYLGQRPPDWLTTDWVLHAFGNTESIAREAYREFMVQDQRESTLALIRLGSEHDDRVLGSDSFLETIAHAPPRIITEQNLEQLIIEVCEKHGVAKERLSSVSRERKLTQIRAEIGFMARENGVASVKEVAARFGRSHAGISRAITKFANATKIS